MIGATQEEQENKKQNNFHKILSDEEEKRIKELKDYQKSLSLDTILSEVILKK